MSENNQQRNSGIPQNQNSLHISTQFADENHLADVLGMYMSALAEIQDYIEPIDFERCADTVYASWLVAPTILLLKAGELIGFAGLRTFRPLHSQENCLCEYMFYVKREHRSLTAAKALSDAVKAVADKFKMRLHMSHMVFDTPVLTKEKFLKRWGYKVWSLGASYFGGAHE